MKKLISLLLSFSLLFVVNFSFVKAENHENTLNEQSTILRNKFSLNEDLSITEYVFAKYDLDSYAIYLTTFQDDSYELKIFVNGELSSHTSGLNGNYELALFNYNKQFVIVPFNCPLTDDIYQHFFVSSDTFTYTPSILDTPEANLLSYLVGLLLGYFSGTAGFVWELGTIVYGIITDTDSKYGMIVENYYEVYLRSNGQYYCVCKHYNVIPTDSEGRVIAGGGMYYFQY